MSSTDRQNRLLVAEDWRRIYQSFKNADFQSYDFENLRRVMIDYLRENFPEDFNDYIESSEYLALIDMIAFLGQSFAFRVDLNARDNFLELAERRESVLRLARTLSYNAKRNKAANGLLKWQSINTTESVIDSNGRNLAGQEIIWNDPANSDWFDQFSRVVNAALPITSQFGNPVDKGLIYNIPTETYRFRTSSATVPIYGYTKVIDGRTMNFEIVSTIIQNGRDIVEDPPLVGKPLSFTYRDDGKGASSNSTGFFSHFRQGSLNTGTFTINQPSTNEIVDIDSTNINNTDVWLYRLDSNGLESEYWTQVPTFEANNIIYNSLKKDIRNIYSVVTRANDRVSVAFSDGTFGNLPSGTFRIYYRVSNGLSYTINSKDMKNVTIEIPYVSNNGQLNLLSISMGLVTSVANSAQTESNDQIKTKAPATYYTQNRMITAEDYNISPLGIDQDIVKVKSVNRTSSGISRYFDLIDPTGKYSSTSLFSDDGIVYKEEYEDAIRFSYNTTVDIEGIIYNQILPLLKENSLRNYYYNKFGRVKISLDLNYRWYQETVSTNQSTGHFIDSSNDVVGYDTTTIFRHLEVGSLFKFVAPNGKTFLKDKGNKLVTIDPNKPLPYNSTDHVWAKIVNISNTGITNLANGDGPVAFNIEIPTSAILSEIIPRWRTNLDADVISLMVNLIFSNKPFGLRYDIESKSWRIVLESNLNVTNSFNIGKAGDNTSQRLDSSWLLLFTTDTEFYSVKSRKLRYIFESDKETRFYYDGTNKVFDTRSNTIIKDKISMLSVNKKPNNNEAFTYDLTWEINKEYTGSDGYIDTKKIEISFFDSNDDGVVDDPDLFDLIVSPLNNDESPNLERYIILENYETSTGQLDYRYIFNNDTVLIKNNSSEVLVSEKVHGQYFYFVESDSVAKWDNLQGKYIYNVDYKVFQGRSNIRFQYIHSADYEIRIDPGQINIVDTYILTKQYDIEFRKWLLGAIDSEPLPPSSDELNLMLSHSLNQIKAMSDEIIYHPVKYKVLFGSKAASNLRASFKLVKNSEQTISDNDIIAKVLNAINEFFTLENWDFGDTFYFSELVAYIMNKTTPYLVNILIVPRSSNLSFGSLFEIPAESDQIFISGATSDDIEVIDSITASAISAQGNIRIDTRVVSQQNVLSKLGSY